MKNISVEEEMGEACLSPSHHGAVVKNSSPSQFADQTTSKQGSVHGVDDAFKTTQSKRNKDVDMEILTHGWTLHEDDLSWVPQAFYKSHIQEYKANTDGRQSALFERHQPGRGKEIKLLRLLRKRTGASRLRYIAELNILADIAKKAGSDLPTFLEMTEVWAPPILLPCMQCYEKCGGKNVGPMMLPPDKKGNSNNHKCLTCGGKVQTVGSFGRMIRQMRDVIEDKGLVPHDVYPDGNCMFAAVVDQLRIRGDFSFTTHTLRQSAVKYLKENPTTDDGTPLQMFLTDGETWHAYTRRMSENGEWGDHMILRALANVINMKIVIYGGASGNRETILCPKALPGNNDLSETGDKVAVDDSVVAGDDSVVYLAHVSESHYMSLRQKHWRQNLQKGLHRRLSLDSTLTEERLPNYLVPDINFVLRHVFRMYISNSSESEFSENSVPSRIETVDFALEMFGSQICKLVPCKLDFDSVGPDISMFFPSVKEEKKIDCCFQNSDFTVFSIPYDTEIVSALISAKVTDLIAENDTDVVGHLKLFPKTPKIWKGQTTSLMENTTYVKTFEINFNKFEEVFPSKLPKECVGVHFVLAFKCSWPDIAENWPHRVRRSGFPNEPTIENVVKSGCHVVSLTSDTRMSDILDDPVHYMTSVDDHTWSYSFAAAEKEICRFLSSEQRQSFHVFKVLVDITLKSIPFPQSVVKSVFFYACENIEKSSWKSKPGKCFFMLLKKIVHCLKNRHVPHYFMPGKNLLNFIPDQIIDECFERLDGARLQPVITLYFLLDQINVMPSEMGGFVEGIIENIHADAQTGTEVSLVSQISFPNCTGVLKDLILQEHYEVAKIVFEDIVEEQGRCLGLDYGALLKTALWDSHIGFIWCFALYFDVKQKTTLTITVCEGYGTIHVTEVFGPDCIAELPDTVVPDCFSISNGDLTFVIKVYEVLLQTVSEEMVIRSIKYYLKRYGELAGDSLVLPDRNAEVTPDQMTQVIIMQCFERLHRIYVYLYNFCDRCKRVEEFREMMSVFTLIAESLGTPLALANIQLMWKRLDESEKSES
ncbi:uncharacterized protein LOC123561457 isoform X2 [Mercenaria mercenaria]|uniref:uncharacterized protein LOC123561457 isoform X2 n=1 Tax=Mercenaria mercenaria TaxID=6596 RepID=UPI00234F54E8|nr:uncharacterized protein LOC123561457 isoform X2 [Mercenaria mercenaria]